MRRIFYELRRKGSISGLWWSATHTILLVNATHWKHWKRCSNFVSDMAFIWSVMRCMDSLYLNRRVQQAFPSQVSYRSILPVFWARIDFMFYMACRRYVIARYGWPESWRWCLIGLWSCWFKTGLSHLTKQRANKSNSSNCVGICISTREQKCWALQ